MSEDNLAVPDGGVELRLDILRHLVQQCTSVVLPSTDATSPTRVCDQSVIEDGDRVNILLSVITAVTDCVALGLSEDDNVIINDLFQHKRPSHPFFSQVYKKSNNGLPAEVLATFCDVSVVKFFRRCNTYSSHHAVEWCLQYLLKMFSTLDPLLQSSGSGWYNAKVKARKASSIARAPVLPFNNSQFGGTAASCDQAPQPHRRKSGYLDHAMFNTTQLNDIAMSQPPRPSGPDTITLESYIPPVTATSHVGSVSSRKRATFKPPSMNPIAEEPPDIISSNTIDMSTIVRFSPDLTEPCSYGNDPLVCMPQPDSLPTSPTDSSSETEMANKKCVRFDEGNEEVDMVEYELHSGVSCEGRIGLIAILSAIANLPVSNKLVDEKSTSKQHDSSSRNELWNDTVCGKVFKLIQKCINSSMFTEQDNEGASDETPNSASYKRRVYQLNRTKPKHNVHQRSLLANYCAHVMQYAFKALIQCALFIRCSANNFCPKCPIKHAGLCSELHEKLSTVCTHSSAAFKKYLQDFVKDVSVEKTLAFLHASLGFCAPAADDDNLGNWYEHKVKIVVSVLKNLMDKIVCLDLTESSMKMVMIYVV